MSIFILIKNFVKDVIPTIDELASVMYPDNMGNLFEPINDLDVYELERKYLKEVPVI